MEAEVPNFYTDSVSVQLSPFGVLLGFMLADPASMEGTAAPVTSHAKIANVRMSLEHAKVLAIMLNRELHKFESVIDAKLPLHPQIVERLDIKADEW